MQKALKMESIFKFMNFSANIHMFHYRNTNVFDFRALPQTVYIVCSSYDLKDSEF